MGFETKYLPSFTVLNRSTPLESDSEPVTSIILTKNQQIPSTTTRENELRLATEFEEKIEVDRARDEKDAADRKEQQVIESIRQQYASQGRDYGQGAATGNDGAGYNDGDGGSYSGQGEAEDYGGGEKDGGIIGYKNGGSTNGSGKAALSAKVKELMDDGYEFGEAVKEAMKQGYMNGGRIKSYFKGGLVSLRGR